jgi:hypothetical protein
MTLVREGCIGAALHPFALGTLGQGQVLFQLS